MNGDGIVNIFDLVLVGGGFGTSGKDLPADVNRDGVVNIFDLVTVAAHFGETTNQTRPAAPQVPSNHHVDLIEGWLIEARVADDGSEIFKRGITVLESLLNAIVPERTALLQNYPNPFNPETWIPYQLASDAVVQITIYETKGALVRQLNVDHQRAGYYVDRQRAVYWDGRDEMGELVASGLYFYQLRVGDFVATRKMVILK